MFIRTFFEFTRRIHSEEDKTRIVKKFDFKSASIGEKLKEIIDEITLAMVDKIETHEEIYLNNLQSKETFSEPSSFDDAKIALDSQFE